MLCRRWGARALVVLSSGLVLSLGSASPGTAQDEQVLDPITVLGTKTEEKAIDTLAPVSTVREEQMQQIMPTRTSDIFFGVPGVSFQQRADEPGTSINIRGLQDFGRVNVLIDGARQNFQRSGHNANGAFYLDPELLGAVDVVRGPVANIFGSGAIGGVVSFRTKDVDDILKPGERWGGVVHGMVGSNTSQWLTSAIAAARVGQNVDVLVGGTYRDNSAYRAGTEGTQPIGALTGPGQEVFNSGSEVETGMAKVTVRPADGHSVRITGLTYNSDYNTGQPGATLFDTNAQQHLVTGGWRYSRPDDKLFDFDGNVYWTRTVNDQTKTCCTNNASTGPLGSKRSFAVDTTGFDLNNTSRFDIGIIRNAITYGVDAFFDEVTVADPTGTGDLFTPNGNRSVAGGFVQWKAEFGTLAEVIGGVRYDSYRLEGGGVTSEGDRISPKITVGIKPLPGITVYGTYAEGYRAPAVTETLITGLHPVTFADFFFLPNPGLRPEVGKTLEAGVNVKFDNAFIAGDRLRAKVNVFQNDVTDYIDLVPLNTGQVGGGGVVCTYVGVFPFNPDCFQYQNIAQARIEGVEFEGMYDAGRWFLGLSASRIDGRDVTAGGPLLTVPPAQFTATVGARFLDRKLELALRWASVAAKRDVPAGALPTDSYDLVHLYAGYKINPDTVAALSVENLFDKYYFSYLDAQTARIPARGLTVKGSLRIRFSDKTING
ncbi:MAG: TonB-dependent hemoglobin/transferrin/lactoferrin family receptor [Rhizobiales bacterium]|nr:TonB-dependent hemoglobin/transferrin/lactoferrin family receptor [Hyphomicrobiales bacterium]